VTGVGIDLIEIERLERALERRPRLAERLFTEAELAQARARLRPGRHLALAAARGLELGVSLTHPPEMAAAVVVAEPAGGPSAADT
jgi:holo-[acyl-carrier protein] synthase